MRLLCRPPPHGRPGPQVPEGIPHRAVRALRAAQMLAAPALHLLPLALREPAPPPLRAPPRRHLQLQPRRLLHQVRRGHGALPGGRRVSAWVLRRPSPCPCKAQGPPAPQCPKLQLRAPGEGRRQEGLVSVGHHPALHLLVSVPVSESAGPEPAQAPRPLRVSPWGATCPQGSPPQGVTTVLVPPQVPIPAQDHWRHGAPLPPTLLQDGHLHPRDRLQGQLLQERAALRLRARAP